MCGKLFFNGTWNLALVTLRETVMCDIVLLTILDSEKFKSDGFFPYILTMTFQCSLCLDDA